MSTESFTKQIFSIKQEKIIATNREAWLRENYGWNEIAKMARKMALKEMIKTATTFDEIQGVLFLMLEELL